MSCTIQLFASHTHGQETKASLFCTSDQMLFPHFSLANLVLPTLLFEMDQDYPLFLAFLIFSCNTLGSDIPTQDPRIKHQALHVSMPSTIHASPAFPEYDQLFRILSFASKSRGSRHTLSPSDTTILVSSPFRRTESKAGTTQLHYLKSRSLRLFLGFAHAPLPPLYL